MNVVTDSKAIGRPFGAVDGIMGRAGRRFGSVLRFIRAKPIGAFGAFVIFMYICLAIFGSWLAPYGYDDFDLTSRLQGPSFAHFFGTDEQGRDIFSRVIFGARTSVVIGFASVALSTSIAAVLGVTSGYFGGWFDLAIQRVVDVSMAFPGLIFIMFMGAVFGTSTLPLVVSLGILFAASSTRMVRSQSILVRAMPYIEASETLGCSHWRIMTRHVFPNVLFILIISASVQVGAIILVETSLAFLGLGTPPPFPSWGRMLQDAQSQMRDHPYLAVFPGAAIALAVYAMNMLGDALRDWWDPRLHE